MTQTDGHIIPKEIDQSDDAAYTWDFVGVLDAGDTIASFSFPSTPAGITIHDGMHADTEVTAFVRPSGTTPGNDYDVPCVVVTSATIPSTFERRIRFRVRRL